MIAFEKTIVDFRKCTLDLDCKRMVLSQRKENGECFEGPGCIRQHTDGTISFKIYVTKHNAQPFAHINRIARNVGKIYSEEMFFDLEAIGSAGTRWTSKHILPSPHWDFSDGSVLVHGRLQSITAHLDREFLGPSSANYLRLHFFEEYEVPRCKFSEVEEDGRTYPVRDSANFCACGLAFELQQRAGSGDTIIEVSSENAFPDALDLRIQEALQYITKKTAIWRARLEITGDSAQLELAVPWRKASRTQFHPPLSPASIEFPKHGLILFAKYLEYAVATAGQTYWHPVAYHLYNACEATAGSVDAMAVGLSVAVEALTSLIPFERQDDELRTFQTRVREWLAEQSSFSKSLIIRARGQIDSMSNKRPQDVLYGLANSGHIDQAYIQAWTRLRNRHVHPKLSDLSKPDPADNQELSDNIHRVEVLLNQLTFFLIGYEGPFSDYGCIGSQDYLSKQYPLKADTESNENF